MSALRFGTLILGLVSFSPLAFSRGAYSPTRATQVQAMRAPAPAQVVHARPFIRTEDPTAAARLRLGPALGLLNNTPGYGGLSEIAFSTGAPFYIGVESGYLRWKFNAGEGEISTEEQLMAVPILASFLYRFNIKNSIVHPYLGVALGAAIVTSRTKTESPEASTNDQRTEIGFAAFAKPGIEFDLTPTASFFLEPRFGTFRSKFHFMPQVGLSFAL